MAVILDLRSPSSDGFPKRRFLPALGETIHQTKDGFASRSALETRPPAQAGEAFVLFINPDGQAHPDRLSTFAMEVRHGT